MTPYETLGVAPDATDAAIKAAYRSLVWQHHPDRGGDNARMASIQVAYDLLCDPERRVQFDTTGQTAPLSPRQQRVQHFMGDLLDTTLENLAKDAAVDTDYVDIVQLMRDATHAKLKQGKALQHRLTQRIQMRDKVHCRLRGTGPMHSLLVILNDNDRLEMSKNEDTLGVLFDALELLAAYNYDAAVRYEFTTDLPGWQAYSTGGV